MAAAAPRFDAVVFSGGGTRCFWHGGFCEVVAPAIGLSPAHVAAVSGGALSAAAFVGGREETLLSVMGEAFERLDHNVRPHKLLEDGKATPHQRTYGKVVAATLDEEACRRIADGPTFEVLLSHPPSRRLPRLSTYAAMAAYGLELKVRSTPHMDWPDRLGMRHTLVDARAAAREGRLVALVCAAATIPPVFDIDLWEGEQVVDGGMSSKAPLPDRDLRNALVLLTRRFRNLPAHANRTYVMPSEETPADKIDFTSRRKIEATWDAGTADASSSRTGSGPAAGRVARPPEGAGANAARPGGRERKTPFKEETMARTALVTGGTRGIGAAISVALKEAGHTVVANYAGNDEKAAAFKAETGIHVEKFDVGDVEACAQRLKAIEAEVGPIDVLVNNAGITRDATFHRMTFQQWSEVINTNLNSLFAVTQPLINGMRDRGWGRIVNISSINGQKGQVGQSNYSAAKAGVIGFTKALAQENAKKGITANVICPGYINTDMVAAVPEKVLEGIIATIPVGRLGEASEIAHLVRYLASDEAAFMTGAVLTINGAQYIANG